MEIIVLVMVTEWAARPMLQSTFAENRFLSLIIYAECPKKCMRVMDAIHHHELHRLSYVFCSVLLKSIGPASLLMKNLSMFFFIRPSH